VGEPTNHRVEGVEGCLTHLEGAEKTGKVDSRVMRISGDSLLGRRIALRLEVQCPAERMDTGSRVVRRSLGPLWVGGAG
jgi:hypothetical protein